MWLKGQQKYHCVVWMWGKKVVLGRTSEEQRSAWSPETQPGRGVKEKEGSGEGDVSPTGRL